MTTGRRAIAQSLNQPPDDGKAPLWVRLATAVALMGSLLLFVMVVAFALPALGQADAAGIFSWLWQPSQGQFGILPMLVGSFLLSIFAVLLGWPVAMGICCWTLEHARGQGRLVGAVRGMVRCMTAIPTVVYGFAAVFLLTPLIRAGMGGTGLSLLTAGLVLTVLIVPTMILVMEAGLRPRLQALCPQTLALGLSRLEILLHIVLPISKKTLITAAVLGFGRAMGDTLIPLMLAGNAAQVPQHLHEGLRSLTSHMALVTANEVGGGAYNSLFVAGMLLLLCNALVSLSLRRLEQAKDAQKDAQVECSTGDTPSRPPRGGVDSAAKNVFGRGGKIGTHGLGIALQGRNALAVLVRCWAWLATLVVMAVVVLLLLFLLWRALPALNSSLFFGSTPPWQALLGLRPVWDGIWPACVGTLCLVGLTLCLALFPGVGCGVYLAEYASPRQQRRLGCIVDMLAGTPSIVMGLFGFMLILLLRRHLWPEANTSLLLAAGCLALLVLPMLIVTTREACHAVPESLRLTAAALGLTKAQRIRHVLLPAASRGIGGGLILALGRAAEDTAVILLTGVVANAGLPAGLGAKFEALPFAIFYTAAQYQTQDELTRGFGAAIVLLVLSAGLVLGARAVEHDYRRRCQGYGV